MNAARPITWIGSTGYYLSRPELARVKRCASLAHLDWRPIAARPSTALQFCAQVERHYPGRSTDDRQTAEWR